jgi:hypothetical protein
MDNELEITWIEAVLAFLEVELRHLLQWDERIHDR